jgi:NAD(P)-dependent dehydrogenase (short-subunit alcohol dehydrogenase family)
MDINTLNPIAVVTGANRGIGSEVCQQLAQTGMQVVLTSHDDAKGNTTVEKLQRSGLNVLHQHLDVTDSTSLMTLTKFIQSKFGHLEVLVNNAGVLLESWDDSTFETTIATLRTTMEVNAFAPSPIAQALLPLMQVNHYGRIVNVSSGVGQLTDMNSGCPADRLSKTALNAVTRILADELRDPNILVNSVCPGWVKTDMGGANAPTTVQQGADPIVWLTTRPDGSPTGGFWRDRKLIPG